MSKSAIQLLDDIIAELEAALPNRHAEHTKSNGNKKEKKEPKASEVETIKSEEEKKQPKAKKAAVETKGKSKEPSWVGPLNVNAIDLRVGVIVKVQRHETAEKLYTEEIDVGEDQPRQIASGLVPHYTLDEMMNRRLIVVCNLKPRNLVGFKSHGMVLCATGKDGKVEFVDPPTDAKPGDRIFGEGLQGEPMSSSQVDKQKAFETIAATLVVDSSGVAMWNGVKLVTSAGGMCIAPTVRDAPIH